MVEPTELRVVPEAEGGLDFELFFRTEYGRLFQALYLLTGDTHNADDIVQEALLRAYERWDRVARMDSPAGFVYRTALNLHRSRLRNMAVRARRVFALVPAEDPGPIATTGIEVRSALARLPHAQREAIVLIEWLGLSSEEAGRVLRIDASSVRGRLHRGRAALRELLGETHE